MSYSEKTKSLNIPEQYLPIMPYLIVHNAKALLSFSKDVFGATEQMIVTTDDNKIRHGEIRIADAVLMFADATGEWVAKTAAMFMYIEDVKKVYNLALKYGAISLEAPQQKEYGFSAGFEDPFGNHWFISEPL